MTRAEGSARFHVSISGRIYEMLRAVAHARSVPIPLVLEDALAPVIGRTPERARIPLADGAALRAWRIGRGLTQLELAEQLGIGNRPVSRWETGRRAIGAEQRAALLALGFAGRRP